MKEQGERDIYIISPNINIAGIVGEAAKRASCSLRGWSKSDSQRSCLDDELEYDKIASFHSELIANSGNNYLRRFNNEQATMAEYLYSQWNP
ncbi:hypothetical protein FACS189491_10790 [Spirochaetia bacterium]|nr:hypothetical protein FACS189491_10790 [Spirochaetia bacterium]